MTHVNEAEVIELSVVFFATVFTVGFVLGAILCLIPHSAWLKQQLRGLLEYADSEEIDASTSSKHELVSRPLPDPYGPTTSSSPSPSRAISSTPTEPMQRNLPIPGEKTSKYSTAGLKIKKKPAT